MLKRFTGKNGPPALPNRQRELDALIAAWLRSKRGRTDSKRTEASYGRILALFRERLQQTGNDLDAHESLVYAMAEQFAKLPLPDRYGQVKATLKGTTINQRIAALSSFYTFAMKQPNTCIQSNPVRLVQRAKVKAHASSRALDLETVQAGLAKINQSTLVGQRDWLALMVAISTGRRISEVASLCRDSVEVSPSGLVTLYFARIKGGESATHRLSRPLSRRLLAYLQEAYGEFATIPPSRPLWMNCSRHDTGRPLTIYSLERISRTYLGTSAFHRIRHTYARTLRRQGATLEEVRAAMGHKSLDYTDIYIRELEQADAPYADMIAAALGLSDEEGASE